MMKRRLSEKQKEAKRLKKRLPHGAMTEIAESLNMTPQNVSKVFNGLVWNESVIDQAIAIIKREKKVIEKMKSA